ncbi:MAG: hypothetical protein ABSC95_29100, partial [Acetobacteraceae bacterium]
MSGIAAAQTTSSETTTTTTATGAPVVVSPQSGTLSTTRIQRTDDGRGTETDSRRTTYRNENGVADDSVTTRTTQTMPPPVATSS